MKKSLLKDYHMTTRLEIAKAIYELEKSKLNWQHKITADEYAKRCVYGIGVMKPMRKTELQNRLNALINREVV